MVVFAINDKENSSTANPVERICTCIGHPHWPIRTPRTEGILFVPFVPDPVTQRVKSVDIWDNKGNTGRYPLFSRRLFAATVFITAEREVS